MKKIQKIHIIGMGALGILYGSFFTEKLGKEAVTFIGDAKRLSRFEREGVFFGEERCGFRMVCGGRQEPCDLLIFAVKGTALTEAMELCSCSVGEDTVILSVLNGISSEEILGARFGAQHLVYTVAQGMDATKVGNRLTCRNCGELRIGVPAGGPFEKQQRDHLRRVRELFDRIGFPYTEEQDIVNRLYSKWMLNVGCNQTVMVNEGTYRTIQPGGAGRETFIAAMREALAVARADGVDLTEQDMEDYIALIDTLSPDGMPSMRQDGLAERPSEVALFSGILIEKSETYGIDAPVNRALYRRIREIEGAYGKEG